MKRIIALFFNIIVVIISSIAVLGYFFKPIFSANVTLAFTPELAEILFPSASETEEDDNFHLLVKELAKEKIAISALIKIETADFLNCGLSSDTALTEEFLKRLLGTFADGFDKQKLDEIENAVARASVKTVIKEEIKNLAVNGEDLSVVMENIGITDDYIGEKTTTVLDAFKAEDATVNSVTDSVMTIVDDVYSKIEGSDYADQVEDLTPTQRELIENEIKSGLEYIADENGNINGDELISNLIASLFSQTKNSNTAMGAPNRNIAFALTSFTEEPTVNVGGFEGDIDVIKTDSSAEQNASNTLKAELLKLVTPASAKVVKIIMTAGFAFIAFSCLTWLWLIVKIILKLWRKNPLIKLKCPILFGWAPFTFFYVTPNAFFSSLASPPAFLANLLGAKIMNILSAIFGTGIKVTVSSSAVFAFVCAIALFIFGFFYVPMRKAMRRGK